MELGFNMENQIKNFIAKSVKEIHNKISERQINENYFTVIDNLISDLIDNKIINKIYSDNFGGNIKKISYFVIKQKPYWGRINEKKMIIIIIINNKPKICLKFYLNKNKKMKEEFDNLEKFYKIYDGVGIVRPLGNFSFNGIDFLAEEVTHILTLAEFIMSYHSDDSIYKFLSRVFNYYSFLNSKSQPSTFENFKEDLLGIVTEFQKKYLPSNEEMEIINKSFKIILEDAENKPILKKYRNIDLNYSNILTDGKSFVMTDIAEIDQTHLYFLDLFGFIQSLDPISKYLYNSLKKIEDTDEIKKLISDFSSHFYKDKKMIAQRLFFKITEVNKEIFKLRVGNQQIQMKNFLKKTSNRYNSLTSP